MRVELTRRNRHYPLKVACLPIPPPAREKCPEQDSNLHASRHTHLKRARLPIPPPGPFSSQEKSGLLPHLFDGAEDGTRTRDPNLGKVMLYQLSYFRDNGCKDTGIFLFSKSLLYFLYYYFLHTHSFRFHFSPVASNHMFAIS